MWGVSAELRMPIHNGEGTWATHSLTRLGIPLREFLGVRCGKVTDVSKSLGCI